MKKSGLIEMYANAMTDEKHASFKAISVCKKRNECQARPTTLEASEFLQTVRRVQDENGTECSPNTKQADGILPPLTTRQLGRLPCATKAIHVLR